MSAFDVVNMAGVVVAIGLGLYNLIDTRRKDKREREDKESVRIEEEATWELYAELVEASKKGLLLSPAIGSDLHRRAERLVERGMLARFPMGHYGIPGQMIAVGTRSKTADNLHP